MVNFNDDGGYKAVSEDRSQVVKRSAASVVMEAKVWTLEGFRGAMGKTNFQMASRQFWQINQNQKAGVVAIYSGFGGKIANLDTEY